MKNEGKAKQVWQTPEIVDLDLDQTKNSNGATYDIGVGYS